MGAKPETLKLEAYLSVSFSMVVGFLALMVYICVSKQKHQKYQKLRHSVAPAGGVHPDAAFGKRRPKHGTLQARKNVKKLEGLCLKNAGTKHMGYEWL